MQCIVLHLYLADAPHAAIRYQQVGVEALDRHITAVPVTQVHLTKTTSA